MDVLEDITFEVEPGEKIGICGRTGRYSSSTFVTYEFTG